LNDFFSPEMTELTVFICAHFLRTHVFFRHTNQNMKPTLTIIVLWSLIIHHSNSFTLVVSHARFNSKIRLSGSTKETDPEIVDVAIVGAGIGGLCAGAILNTLYGKKVGIYESHYLPGGCAHAFEHTAIVGGEKITFTFDSGPTIVLGCSRTPYNPLRQILNAVGVSENVTWIPYESWGMIEHPLKQNEIRWNLELGPDSFQNGPLTRFGGHEASIEFEELRKITKGLVDGATEIPAMAMRSGPSALIPLLRYLPALIGLIKQGEEVKQGTFKPYIDGPKYVVKNEWLRDWLDALAFSLSGLPASRTSAAAMAYVLYDMHREGAALDYPKGGLGSVVTALVKGVEKGNHGSRVNLRQHVASIDTSSDGKQVQGLTLRNGKKVIANDGVICNAPVWCLQDLLKNPESQKVLNNSIPPNDSYKPRQSWITSKHYGRSKLTHERASVKADELSSLLEKCSQSEQTGSFLHLHVALDVDGLNLDSLQAHYTIMDRGLSGDKNDEDDGPCGELNMIAVSNPCVLDRSLAPPGYIVMHAYGAGNEPYEIWKDLDDKQYQELKEERATVLWRAIESIIPDAKRRAVVSLIGSPRTHERFLRRPNGTYGSATEDYLKDGSTPIKGLTLAGDGVFPGIGIPAVALSGASAANSVVSPWKQWECLDRLKEHGHI
jgi:phytoene dehydrogenase-like protein